MFGKIAKEICISAKLGDPNPDTNPRLRAAIEAARKHSVPRDTIDRAIKKGAGLLDEQVHYETVVYEGFAPHKVPVIVECLTDNKNRTASNIRVLFRKGQIGPMGSVQWMFDRVGVIEAVSPETEVDLEEAAIEAGAQDVEALEEFELQQDQKGGRFYTEPADLDIVNKALSDAGWVISFSELSYRPKTPVSISKDQKKEVEDFLGNVDVDDDVHRVYVAL